jgi:hypothetical protein
VAFTAEDGTGVTGSNSLVSVSAADTYFSDRNNTTWAAKTTAQKQAALLEGTAYLEGTYVGQWPGTILKETQGLSWPREYAYDRDRRELTGVPVDVQAAVCELAFQSFSGALAPSTNGAKRVKRIKGGSAEIEYETSRGGTAREYPFVTRLLSRILSGPGGTYNIALRRV